MRETPLTIPNLSGTRQYGVTVRAEGYEESSKYAKLESGATEVKIDFGTLSKAALVKQTGFSVLSTFRASNLIVEVDGKKIALFNVDGAFYAIDDTCTHRGGPLSEGELNGNEVSCPLHGARFDVTSGAELSPPAPRGVARYNVRVDGEDVAIEV